MEKMIKNVLCPKWRTMHIHYLLMHYLLNHVAMNYIGYFGIHKQSLIAPPPLLRNEICDSWVHEEFSIPH